MTTTRADRSKSERSDVKRTRKAIEDAYHSLVYVKPYDKITVTDVINEANISRGTFYAYYSDIRDLAETVGYKLVARLKDLIKDVAREHLTGDTRQMVDIIAGDLEDHRDNIRILHEKNGRSGLLEKLRSNLKEGLVDEFESFDEPKRSVLLSCIVGTIIDSCTDWVLDDEPCDRKILVDTVTGFITHGIESFSSGR